MWTPEVVAVGEGLHHRVGDAADARLQRGAVGDEARHVAADGPGHLVELAVLELRQRAVHRDQVVDVVHVEEGVAQGPGHLRVDLGDDEVGGLHPGADHVHRDPEAHVAVAVRGRDLDQRHVDAHPPAADELGDLREEDGHEVGPALLHRLPDVGADEERGVPEAPLQPRGHVGRRPQGEEVDDLVVGEVAPEGDQALHQAPGHRGPGADEDPPPPGHGLDGLLHRADLRGKGLLPGGVGHVAPRGSG